MYIFTNLALVLIILLQLVGNLTDRLPGDWQMFSVVEEVQCSIYDNTGKIYDVNDYIYENYYIIKKSICPPLAEFICLKESLQNLLTLEVNSLIYKTDGCEFNEISSSL